MVLPETRGPRGGPPGSSPAVAFGFDGGALCGEAEAGDGMIVGGNPYVADFYQRSWSTAHIQGRADGLMPVGRR
jgi:hypothetical protein